MGGGDNKVIWVVANWKSNKTIAEALEWISKVGPKIPKNNQLKVVVCPTFSALSEIKKAITVANFPIFLGAQNLSPFDVGSYTGEEPAAILSQIIDLAILGHSERRNNFAETDEMVVEKTKQALSSNIIPLVCVQNEATQVPNGSRLIAYEPSFAIGTGNADNPENANKVAEKLKEKYGSNLEVLYGGSVSVTNVQDFIMQPNLSGVLIGKASLSDQEFIKICQAVLERL